MGTARVPTRLTSGNNPAIPRRRQLFVVPALSRDPLPPMLVVGKIVAPASRNTDNGGYGSRRSPGVRRDDEWREAAKPASSAFPPLAPRNKSKSRQRRRA